MKKPWENGLLRVMGNKQYFVNGTTPFFLLGDTAWTLFQRLTLEQTYTYLKNRKEKGYTAIAAVLTKNPGSDANMHDDPSVYNEENFFIPDNQKYWGQITATVKMAEEMGMYMMLLPVWGNVMKDGTLNAGNAEAYTNFLIEKFAPYPNVIWSLGGDVRGDVGYEAWCIMGRLFKQKDPDRLVGYHPFGRTSSSYWFQDQEWLDFHMFQSGHRRFDQRDLKAWDDAAGKEPWFGEESFRYVDQDLNKEPKRPILDGEPSYELIPQGLHDSTQPYWQAQHARRYAYWSVLSGAAGHVYGHNAIMQFYDIGQKPAYGALEPWYFSQHDVGGSHMQIMKDLMVEMGFENCQTMPQILDKTDWKEQDDTNIAFGNEKNIVVYSFSGKSFKTLALPELKGTYEAYWVDPTSGVKSYFGDFTLDKPLEFTPPNKKVVFNDWLLYLCVK